MHRKRRLGIALATAAVAATATAPAAMAGGPHDGDRKAGGKERLVGAVETNRLIVLRADQPHNAKGYDVVGLGAGEEITGLDVRPATGDLFAKAKQGGDDVAGGNSNLYRIELGPSRTARATFVATYATQPAGRYFGFDFNPTVDLIRTISDSNDDKRSVPDTGATTQDGPLAYAASDVNAGRDPDAVGAAYTNSFFGPPNPAGTPAGQGRTTTLYDIDARQDVLAIQAPPNAGTLNTVGSLGVDTTNTVGFDISPFTGAPYAALQRAGAGRSGLYRIDLQTGRAVLVGSIDAPPVEALAVLEDHPGR